MRECQRDIEPSESQLQNPHAQQKDNNDQTKLEQGLAKNFQTGRSTHSDGPQRL
jgi:hypothetical protein